MAKKYLLKIVCFDGRTTVKLNTEEERQKLIEDISKDNPSGVLLKKCEGEEYYCPKCKDTHLLELKNLRCPCCDEDAELKEIRCGCGEKMERLDE